jgi:NAD(P)-dependent dehydrogenase (short-subunit alcohol dehydrogenase family)
VADWSLAGKVFLITGGAGGIGAAGAGELTRRGAVVVLADLDPEGLARTAAEIGGDPLTVEVDVTDLSSCEAAVAAAVGRHGRVDAVWANAGIASFGSAPLTDPAAWKRTVDVNLTGAFNTVRAALPAIVESSGYVAITASLASFAAPPLMSAYAASKAGVEAFANSLRMEVAHLGVDVCTIHPTWIATRMVSETARDLEAYNRLRAGLPWPLNKTYPVERAASDIAKGFARRRRRIVSPGWVRALVVGRAALTTRAAERDFRKAAPEAMRLYEEQVAREGAAEASASARVREQV